MPWPEGKFGNSAKPDGSSNSEVTHWGSDSSGAYSIRKSAYAWSMIYSRYDKDKLHGLGYKQQTMIISSTIYFHGIETTNLTTQKHGLFLNKFYHLY